MLSYQRVCEYFFLEVRLSEAHPARRRWESSEASRRSFTMKADQLYRIHVIFLGKVERPQYSQEPWESLVYLREIIPLYGQTSQVSEIL